MPLSARRVLFAAALCVGVAAATFTPLAAYSAPAGPGASAQQPAQDVIVMLRNQHTDLSITKGHRTSPRTDAAKHDQAPLIATAQKSGVRNIHGFKTINGFA